MSVKTSIICASFTLLLGSTVAAAADEAAVGMVLVLANERLIEGDIRRDGDWYHVRRAQGEARIPAQHALRLCASREAAYAYVRTRANADDPDERLRLARWCRTYGLHQQALDEVSAAIQLRPANREYRRILETYQRAAPPHSPPPRAPTAKASEAETAPPPADLNMELVSQFAVKIQPILMNTCASCHSGDDCGSFKLTRPYEGKPTNRRGTQKNLAAVLQQIDVAHWQTSPLLLRAATLHGEAKQWPIKDRRSPVFRTLEDWVQRVAPAKPAAEEVKAKKAPDFALEADGAKKDETENEASPKDPYDPSIFNRQTAPALKPAAAKP